MDVVTYALSKTPDWNNIKNRPFYDYYDYIEIGGNNGTFSEGMDLGMAFLYTDSNAIGTDINDVGIKLIVNFDSVDYKCVSKFDPIAVMFYAGNGKLLTNNDEDDTGEPFIIIDNLIFVKNKNEQHFYSIRKYMEVIQCIPSKYIPKDGNVQPGDRGLVPGYKIYDAVNEAKGEMSESLDYNLLKNRPFYEEMTYKDIISQKTDRFTFRSSSSDYYCYFSAPDIYTNNDLIISVNGVDYDLKFVKSNNIYGGYWGDPTYENCPIYIDPIVSQASGFEGYYIYISNSVFDQSTVSSKEVSIRLYYISDRIVHQIDPKFIPNNIITDVLSFNESGELVVTLGGVSKTFVAKE